MASIFRRMFKWGQSEAHSALDRFEDPIKMTEQGIRDLKKDLEASLKSLAEVKALAIRGKREAAEKKEIASDYEKKAMLLLKKGESGNLDNVEADRLAMEALNKKEEVFKRATSLLKDTQHQEGHIAKLESNIQHLKGQISKWENETASLKARAKVSVATKKLNAQMAKVDSNGTVAMLEKMKDKVAEEEALAESYGEIAQIDKSIDNEIESALKGETPTASDSLAALKAKMGINK
ncbi:MAG: PspA/IM30 family protein [Kiritimatiellae bacterium]|nr:PspA/IM30 family protein [Kiritimatiellia bacterium]